MEQNLMNQNNESGIKRLKKYRWLVWGIATLAYGVVFFHRLSAGVVRLDLIETFNITDSTFSLIGTTYFYVYLLMQIPTGMLVDSIGPRKTISAGIFFASIGSIIFGSAVNVAFLICGRFLVGLGVSVVFVSILKILSQWFRPAEFGTMTGITCFIGTMGGVLAQTPLAMLVEKTSWRASFIGFGVVSLALSVALYTFVRNNPKEMGMPSIDELEGKVSMNSGPEVKQSGADIVKSLVIILKNKRTWPVFFMYAGFYGAFVTIMGFWGTSYISDVYLLDNLEASKYIIAGVFGSACGSLAIGKLTDFVEKRKWPMLAFGAMYVLSWATIVVFTGGKPPLSWMYAILFMLGFSSTGYVVGWAAGKEVNPPENVGVATAVVNMGGFFGSIAIPPLLGRVFDTYMGQVDIVIVYQKAFSYSLAASIIGLIAGFFMVETNTNNIYVKKKRHKAS